MRHNGTAVGYAAATNNTILSSSSGRDSTMWLPLSLAILCTQGLQTRGDRHITPCLQTCKHNYTQDLRGVLRPFFSPRGPAWQARQGPVPRASANFPPMRDPWNALRLDASAGEWHGTTQEKRCLTLVAGFALSPCMRRRLSLCGRRSRIIEKLGAGHQLRHRFDRRDRNLLLPQVR